MGGDEDGVKAKPPIESLILTIREQRVIFAGNIADRSAPKIFRLVDYLQFACRLAKRTDLALSKHSCWASQQRHPRDRWIGFSPQNKYPKNEHRHFIDLIIHS